MASHLTWSLILFAIAGCAPQGVPDELTTYIKSRNEAVVAAEPKAKGTSLTLVRASEDGFEVRLRIGEQHLTVIQPLQHYSIEVHFYDGGGKEITPKTLIAISLPQLGESVRVSVAPGTELKCELSKQRLLEMYGGLEACRWVAVTYMPSAFVLEGVNGKPVDINQITLWSNVIRW